MMNMNWIEIP